MKVIGKAGRDKYICEVSHQEIEKFMDLYYGKMSALEPGQEIDLGAGYDFASSARESMKKTREFIESNKATIEAIIGGIRMESSFNGDSHSAKEQQELSAK